MSRRVGDRDGLIKEATAKAIATNDMKKLNGEDAYTAFFDLFEPTFDCENAVIEKGKKMKYPQGLPNYTIGIFLLASQKVKLLNFYNLTVPCVRQTRGDLYGVYKPIITKGDDKYFDNLVNEYKSSATSKDCDEIRRIIMSEAIYGDYGDKLQMTEDPALVPCCNGVYHMYTKEFIDWEESDKRGQVFTNKLAIDYNQNAQDRPWHDKENNRDLTLIEMLSDICGHDRDKLSALLAGMHMMIRKNWEPELCLALVDLNMTGGNGKTTIAGLINSILGKENTCSVPIEQMSKEFMLESVLDKTAIVNPDAKDCTYVEDSSMFKSLSSTDEITVTVKFKSAVTGFKFGGHIFQATQGFMKFKDTSMAIDRRFYFLDCNTHFTGLDSTIKENPLIKSEMLQQKERLEFLLHTLLELGYERMPRFEFQKQLLKEFRSETNPVDEFLNYITDPVNKEYGEHWDDFYPTAWLYPAFCGFYFNTYQKKTTISNKAFIVSLKLWAKRNVDEGWVVPTYFDKKGKELLLKVNPKGRLDSAEFFTQEFDQPGAQNHTPLEKFMNRYMFGSHDPSKVYRIGTMEKQYTCLYKVKEEDK